MNSNIIQMPQNDEKARIRINDEAIVWLVELDCGLSSERKNQLQQWLAQSDQHRSLFLQQAKLWDELDVLSQLADILPYESFVQKSSPTKYYAVAASFIAGILSLILFSQFAWREPVSTPVSDVTAASTTSYSTQKGEFKKHILPDGSVLTLNTDTQANIEFNHHYRNIYLQHGELHIDVVHDTSRPLNIIVGDNLIQAVGTAFNVQFVNKQDVELIVSEGKVMLTDQAELAKNINFARQTIDSDNAVFLNAGQKVSFVQNHAIKQRDLQIEDISDHLASSLSWLKGSLIFSGEPMSYAITMINRYLREPVILEGDNIKSVRVIGRFEQGKLEHFLHGLEMSFNINQHKNAQGQIVLSLAE